MDVLDIVAVAVGVVNFVLCLFVLRGIAALRQEVADFEERSAIASEDHATSQANIQNDLNNRLLQIQQNRYARNYAARMKER